MLGPLRSARRSQRATLVHAHTPACRSTSRSYVRRRPEESAVYRTVQRHLAGFVATAHARNRTVPRFVQRQLYALLDCGILANGFVRLRCECGHERWVA